MDKMRNILDIIKVHDILDSILEGDIPIRVTTDEGEDNTLRGMIVARYVLCWILEHDRGNWFEERMVELEAELFAKGYELKDIKDDPRTR